MQSLKQNYEAYTAEDKQVWKILFQRQMKNLAPVASEAYLSALEKIGFTSDKIPCFEEVNEMLVKETGWQVIVVPGIVPEKEFFTLLSQQTFPATTWLRKMSELDYLEEPDMFHDVFGHIPLLVNPSYCSFLKSLADIALEHMNHPHIIESITRIYWFTIEFGLIQEQGVKKIYGAGVLSSSGETVHCMSKEVKVFNFNIQSILEHTFVKSEMQEHYFMIRSFDELYDCIADIETARMSRQLSVQEL